MTSPFDRYDAFADVLSVPAGRMFLEAAVPEIVDPSVVAHIGQMPIGPLLELILTPDEARIADVLTRLAEIPNTLPAPEEAAALLPDPHYEDQTIALGSAGVSIPEDAQQNHRTEIVFTGPSHGNPFVDVDLTAEFRLGQTVLQVGGFYDGEGRYMLRFLPPEAGRWTFTTRSTARSLDEISGELVVSDSANPGPVRVSEKFGFAHSSGAPFAPFGTTAYAWTHQPGVLQEETLRALGGAPFNKLRMCLFPKSFVYNSNEPDHFVFPRKEEGWDTSRFDLNYFAQLERRIEDLERLGIQADLILFHPYDRWGFDNLGRAVDDRYVSYVVRRLAAFPNVWWSLANEYELITTKRRADWDRIARIITGEDHAAHLLSIHNWQELFDYSADWATHASIQSGDREIGKKVDEWRLRWGKPIIIDEFGYEGDLDQSWGDLTAEDVVERFWTATIRGGYLTHGETFHDDDDQVFWSKGGTLAGGSPQRISFLRKIVSESPTGRLDPLPAAGDIPAAGAWGKYVVIYFGPKRPRFRDIPILPGMTVRAEIIDTWNMTIEEVPGVHEGHVRLELPSRPYIAVRLVAV